MGEQIGKNQNPSSPIQQAIQSFDSFDDILCATQIPQESPLSPSIPPPPFLPALTSREYSTTNAVHMEVQENAKISTFNRSINRSNSVSQQRNNGWAPATQHAVDEMLRLSENDFNLTEMFLQSNDRSSANMAYSSTGKVLGSIGDQINTTDEGFIKHQRPDFPLLTPPFGPVSGRDSPHLQPLLSPMEVDEKQALAAPGSVPVTTMLPSQNFQSYYPYGRSLPLPMTKFPSPEGSKPFNPADTDSRPTSVQTPAPAANASKPPPTQSDPLSVAIATAAAIASQQNDTPNDNISVLKNTATTVNSTRTQLPASANATSSTSSTSSSLPGAAVISTGPISNAAPTAASRTITKAAAAEPNVNTVPRKTLPSATVSPTVYSAKPPSVRPPVTVNNNVKSQPIQIQANLKPGQKPPKSAIPVENTKTSNSTTRKPSGVQTSYYRPPTNSTRPLPMPRAPAPSNSIVEATKRRSQFGFGGNHVVPSVPLPPPNAKSNNASTSRTTVNTAPVVPTATTTIRKGGPRQTNKVPLPPLPAPPTAISACAAYERKKQRAKDARVKLNESIERLAVAISLGGTQSKERANQLAAIVPPPPESKLAELRAETMKIIADCEQSSEGAKKWDRPSFVGAAAVLLQGLNSQCDALMRELVELKENNCATPAVVMSTAQTIPEVPPLVQANENTIVSKKESPPTYMISASKGPLPIANTDVVGQRVEHPIISEPGSLAAPPAKRQKVDNVVIPRLENGGEAPVETSAKHAENNQGQQPPALISGSSSPAETMPPQEMLGSPIHQVFATTSTMHLMSSFMDPQSLCQCAVVSKRWVDMHSFRDNGVWLERCVQRFGIVKVRNWKDNDEDNEENESSQTSKNLYQRMDASNVMPPCQCLIGLMVGECRLPGVASAWVYLVERSNGETLRTVQKKHESSASTAGQSGYTSLPVVELRILIQNIGFSSAAILMKDQSFTVDASTRRKGEEMSEIDWDERLQKRILDTNGSPHTKCVLQSKTIGNDICRLRLFESALFVVHIHARGCSTSRKFQQRAKSVKMLLTVNGITTPLVVPFAPVKSN